MKEISKKINQMDKENKQRKMVIYMKEISKKVNQLDKENKQRKLMTFMTVIL